MTKTVANYTTQPNESFPLDCETMQYIADNASLVEVLGNIAGDKTILHGCNAALTELQRTDGYIFIHTNDYPLGEVLYFEGGNITNGVYVKKETISLNAAGAEYPEAYTKRTLAAGVGAENYKWEDFVRITSNAQLMSFITDIRNQLATLSSIPIGSIMMWSGTSAPKGFVICDGTNLDRQRYATLYGIIGTTYGYSSDKTFRVPDMRGRFVVGKKIDAFDYQNLNNKGGFDKVTLTAEQSGLQEHSHNFSFDAYTNSSSKVEDDARKLRRKSTDNKLTLTFSTGNCASRPAEKAHENRPPYIVLNYIIKVQ